MPSIIEPDSRDGGRALSRGPDVNCGASDWQIVSALWTPSNWNRKRRRADNSNLIWDVTAWVRRKCLDLCVGAVSISSLSSCYLLYPRKIFGISASCVLFPADNKTLVSARKEENNSEPQGLLLQHQAHHDPSITRCRLPRWDTRLSLCRPLLVGHVSFLSYFSPRIFFPYIQAAASSIILRRTAAVFTVNSLDDYAILSVLCDTPSASPAVLLLPWACWAKPGGSKHKKPKQGRHHDYNQLSGLWSLLVPVSLPQLIIYWTILS